MLFFIITNNKYNFNSNYYYMAGLTSEEFYSLNQFRYLWFFLFFTKILEKEKLLKDLF